MNETLHTKYGTAKINNDGYYVISSRKEGNHMKRLHRLIYEDFWGIELLNEIIIHHKDGNKINNCILNLEAMLLGEHSKHHNAGKTPSEETKIKTSETLNSSGYYRVYKNKDKKYKEGFIWKYQYCENCKIKAISSVDINKLEAKVKAKGLPWFKVSVKGDA